MIQKPFRSAVALAFMMATASASAQDKQTIITIVKVSGIPWFKRMEEGVKAFGGSSSGVSTSQVGPTEAAAAPQLKLIEEAVDRKVDAIAIVPTDPAAIEEVARRAMQSGIVVVTHEADNQKNTMADIEAFDNAAFGASLNERMAQCMGHAGKWTSFVGTRGSRTHVQWTDGGAANARKHAGMLLVDALNESNDDADKAYEKAREILKKHPDIKGFQGSASSDVIGIGRAVEEAGLQGKTCVYGTGLPSRTAKLLESGAVKGIGFWDPKNAGLAMNRVAKLLLDKKPITDGMDLGVPGYDKVIVKKGAGGGLLIIGKADVIADKSTYRSYPF
ncbi:LacI family transcriptional regulator [Variovorax sp. WS11]|uniref:substrate-binding domain-containing protein n=1 Tax=Variovorax sp. WS11 TaxID=1105204 RepID=UPI000D0CD23A|nr:substrate-binding domain-containing protein [Variovorax sp. WS11]PSL83392.1 LacI family transcriptional regulator [Variovorax sp. WS11]